VEESLAKKAVVSQPVNDWDRHHYEAMLPGFGGTDHMDWRAFVDILREKGFKGPFEIENEAKISKDTGNLGATLQGYEAAILFLSPMLWNLGEDGYRYKKERALSQPELKQDIPIKTIDSL
jgi:sugar phosphate isomerase/epimerase